MARAKPKVKGEALIVLMDRFAVAILKQAEVAEDLPDKVAAGAAAASLVFCSACGFHQT
jgi:hypothetical protein